MERRLLAILAADVVGYTRLMEADEAATLARLAALRQDVIDPLIAQHQGRLIKVMGDGFLVAFDSVLTAMECALAWQADPVVDASPEPLQFRIGLHLGDVVIEDGDIFGSGVNLASRLEGLAAPGAICLSDSVQRELKGKLELAFEDLGEKTVKNIETPIRVFQVRPGGAPEPANPGQANPAPTGTRSMEKPGIAVLPFDNMSGDPDQEFFADGITEDIITALSKSRWYRVTARNSTFAYKGRSPDIRQVGRELGVDYVLEGSLRKGGKRVRITVQLIYAETGDHVWADRYDRALEDEFAVQDEIARRVSSLLVERIWQDVAQNVEKLDPASYGPFELVFHAIGLVHRLEPATVAEAKASLTRALEADPDLVPGHLGMGFCELSEWVFFACADEGAVDRAEAHAVRLLELAPEDAQTYRLASRIHCVRGRDDESRRAAERALKLNPNDGDIIATMGLCHLYGGDGAEALRWIGKVLELHDETPHTVDIMHMWSALAHFMLRDYDASLASLSTLGGLHFIRNLLRAACLGAQGKSAEAEVAEVLAVQPRFRVANLGLCKMFQKDGDGQHLKQALETTSLPP